MPSLIHAQSSWPQVLVRVTRTEGSAPREPGAFMQVGVRSLLGTVGGGHLEYQAIATARQWLTQGLASMPDAERTRRYPLGPSLGQCCGGVVWLTFDWLEDAAQAGKWHEKLAAPRIPLALFGAGHVGHALIYALAPLDFQVQWIDSRDQASDAMMGIHANSPALDAYSSLHWLARVEADPVDAEVADLVAGTRVLVMSFSHAEDLDIIRACLHRNRPYLDRPMASRPLPFIGLIGSQTKWARFRHRLADFGFSQTEIAQVTCPIGLPGISGKAPSVIAASTVAQLLLSGACAAP